MPWWTDFPRALRRHVVHADVYFGLEAARTGALPISVATVAGVLGFFATVAIASYLVLAALAPLPGPRVASVGARAAAAFAALYLLLFFRDLWWSGAGDWHDPAVRRSSSGASRRGCRPPGEE